MHFIVAELDALAPDAGAAARVITKFDELLESGASLEGILSVASVLTGCTSRLVHADYGVHLRVGADGKVADTLPSLDPRWPCAPLAPGGPPAIWLEQVSPCSMTEAMVLDRAAFTVREVLRRTRSGAGNAVTSPSLLELLFDPEADVDDRLHAARLMQLHGTTAYRAVVTPADGLGSVVAEKDGPRAGSQSGQRRGVGPAVPVLDLPRSAGLARTALRFTAEDTESDPGPSTVLADEISSLILVAKAFDPSDPPADVQALAHAARLASWVLRTLERYTSHSSLRLAAEALYVHHSTLQNRLTIIEKDLGWSVRDPQGRLRIQLALALRRLVLHPG